MTALRALGRVGLELGRFVLGALASLLVAVAVIVCVFSLVVLSALCLLAHAAWPYNAAWRWAKPDAQLPSADAPRGVAAPAIAFLRGVRAGIRQHEAKKAAAQAADDVTERCPHGGEYSTCGACGVAEEIATDERLLRQRVASIRASIRAIDIAKAACAQAEEVAEPRARGDVEAAVKAMEARKAEFRRRLRSDVEARKAGDAKMVN